MRFNLLEQSLFFFFKEINHSSVVTDTCKPIRSERRMVWPRLRWGFCHLLSLEFYLNSWRNTGVRWVRWKEHLAFHWCWRPLIRASFQVALRCWPRPLLRHPSLGPFYSGCQLSLGSSQVHEKHSALLCYVGPQETSLLTETYLAGSCHHSAHSFLPFPSPALPDKARSQTLCLQARKKAPPGTKLTGTLTIDFLDSRTVRK